MPNAYIQVATNTLTTSTTTVTFSDISQAYTDLVVVAQIEGSSDGSDFRLRVNGDTGNNYSRTDISGANDTNHSTFRQSGISNIPLQYATGAGSDQPSIGIINIMNYTSTNMRKTFLIRSAMVRGTSTNKKETLAETGLWSSTSAINSVTIYTDTAFIAGSTFTIYGIKAA